MKRVFTTSLIIVMLLAFTASCIVQAAATGSKEGKERPAKTTDIEKLSATTLLDINTAPADRLTKLPGIGDTYAREIIGGRPYKRTDDLVRKKIIPQVNYDQIKDLIIVEADKRNDENR